MLLMYTNYNIYPSILDHNKSTLTFELNASHEICNSLSREKISLPLK